MFVVVYLCCCTEVENKVKEWLNAEVASCDVVKPVTSKSLVCKDVTVTVHVAKYRTNPLMAYSILLCPARLLLDQVGVKLILFAFVKDQSLRRNLLTSQSHKDDDVACFRRLAS